MGWPGGLIMIITSLGSLSIFYLIFGFNFLTNIRLRDSFNKVNYQNLSATRVIGSIMAGINLSILLIGVIFGLMNWPGSGVMLLISFLPSFVIAVICLIKHLKNSKGYIRTLSRTGVFLVLGLILYFCPIVLQKIRYRNQPKILHAYERYYNEPTNENRKLLKAELNRNIFSKEKLNTKYKDSI
ncbi:hypothetical protein [Pseudofulvibacter geojedonensis]|uniref:Uncharacterized protein n=1 Tax=Pseudofulvibacter geojedonensis TaxID=1123758 RepID=A0ABW3I3M8_9FLAO